MLPYNSGLEKSLEKLNASSFCTFPDFPSFYIDLPFPGRWWRTLSRKLCRESSCPPRGSERGGSSSRRCPAVWSCTWVGEIVISIFLDFTSIIYTGPKKSHIGFFAGKKVDVKTSLDSRHEEILLAEANEADYSSKPTYLGRQYCWKSQSRLQIQTMCTATTPPVMDSWV